MIDWPFASEGHVWTHHIDLTITRICSCKRFQLSRIDQREVLRSFFCWWATRPNAKIMSSSSTKCQYKVIFVKRHIFTTLDIVLWTQNLCQTCRPVTWGTKKKGANWALNPPKTSAVEVRSPVRLTRNFLYVLSVRLPMGTMLVVSLNITSRARSLHLTHHSTVRRYNYYSDDSSSNHSDKAPQASAFEQWIQSFLFHTILRRLIADVSGD